MNVEDGSDQIGRVSQVRIRGLDMFSLTIDGEERVCLAQLSNTLLKKFTYNEIHNRRVALGINCVQCSPMQLELLRRHGAMASSSRRCGMITRKEAERLVKSFLDETRPPALPENFSFCVEHRCEFGCQGVFYPCRYNSSRAKCIRCNYCKLFFSPNKFIFHSHPTPSGIRYNQTAVSTSINFNSWRKHIFLVNPNSDDELNNAWEDVKSIFNSGKRKRNSNSNRGREMIDEAVKTGQDDDEPVETLVSTQSNLFLNLISFFNPFFAHERLQSGTDRLMDQNGDNRFLNDSKGRVNECKSKVKFSIDSLINQD